VFACGNGGSASIANHLQCDHVKCVGQGTDSAHPGLQPEHERGAVQRDRERQRLRARLSSTNWHPIARPGDLLIAVSSSGRSPNIVRALEWAAGHGMQTSR
jgi:D-sedoheptulose 7-phosphate isomerase/D-glycero-D-manno-heptose 1,7-bisphosphate phosphatase